MEDLKKQVKTLTLENKTLQNKIDDFTNLVKKYQEAITENCKLKEKNRVMNNILKDIEEENELLRKELKLKGV